MSKPAIAVAERTLPHNLEAERSVLGAIIVENTHLDVVLKTIDSGDFFRDAHRRIFDCMVSLSDHKSEIDFVTLKNALARTGELDEVGGPAYIAGLADGVPRATNAEGYAAIVKQKSLLRMLIYHANSVLEDAYADEDEAARVIERADRRLMDLRLDTTASSMVSLSSTTAERFKRLEWRTEHKGELTGIDTGYPTINNLTLGWQPGDLIIIGARPSMGKTTFAINTAVLGAQTFRRHKGTVLPEKLRVAVFSLEMRREQLDDRIFSQLAGVPLTRIQSGHLGSEDYKKLSEALETINSLDIHIEDAGEQNCLEIRAACRRLKADGGLDLVVIDYVQLMDGTLQRKGATRNEEITDMSRRLKALARELRAPIILVSQLSRVEGRPKLENLRESGSLEQAADVVILLYRKDHRASGKTECILAKQRNGPTGTINLLIDRDTVTFTDAGEATEDPVAEKKDEEKSRARKFIKSRSRRLYSE